MIADLADRGIAATGACFRPLGGGRTNQVWMFRSARGSDLVLKVYDRTTRNPLFRNDPAAERACLKWLDGSGLAPRPVASGLSGGLAWLVYDHVEGRAWSAGSTQVADLLQRLHRLPPPTGLPVRRGGSHALAGQIGDILSGCRSAWRRRLAGLGPFRNVGPAARPCLVHADPVPGNILVAGDRIVLIDWQCPVLGDPVEDLAIFLSPAMQFLYRGAPLSVAERRAFLRACPDRETVARFHALEPWFLWRMAAYCLWQAERKRPGYARAFSLEYAALAAHMRADRAALPTET